MPTTSHTPRDLPPAAPPTLRARLASGLRGVALDTRPLAHPVFRRLLIGQSAAYVGTMVTGVTIPVQVYALSQSSLSVGLTGLAGLVPLVVFGLAPSPTGSTAVCCTWPRHASPG
ncbi:hypothetical protein ACH40F_55155 [Streptomyces sp. NPDC020794]|uniref:hypothetical protein n=1 Tax=unclassified Streptomyces TaxID=2593676 RepID=UPI0036E3CB5E